MADNVRFDIIARDAASAELKATRAEIDGIARSIAQLDSMASRGGLANSGRATAAAMAGLKAEFDAATAKATTLEAKIAELTTTSMALGERIRVPFASAGREINVTTGSIDKFVQSQLASTVAYDATLIATNKYIDAQNKARGVATSIQSDSIKQRENLKAITEGTNALVVAEQLRYTQETQLAKEALNNNLRNDAAVMEAQRRQRSVQLVSANQNEANQLAGFRSIVASLRQGEEQARKTGAGFRGMAGDIDMTTYAGRKAVTVFDELVSGRRGQMMATFGSIFRDLGISGGSVAVGLGGIAAVFTGVHVAETLARWSEEMGKVALQEENMAAATGQSVDEFITFSTAVQLAGGNAETASRALETLQRRMEEAVLNPSGKTMGAFRAIGISYETLLARLQDTQGAKSTLLDLSDAFVRMGNTADRTTRFTQIAGGTRQLAQIVPILRQGSDGMLGLEQKADDLNPALHENHDNLVRMEERIRALSTAWEGFKASVVGGEGIFSGITTSLTSVLRDLQTAQSYHYDNLKDLQNKGLGAGMPGLSVNRPANVVASAAIISRGGALANQSALLGGVDLPSTMPGNAAEANHILAALGGKPGGKAASQSGQLRSGLASQYQPEPDTSRTTVGFDEATSEKLYTARLRLAALAADQLHQEERQRAILREEADFAAMGPSARAQKMEEVANLSVAAAKSQTELLSIEGQQWTLAKSLSQEDQNALLAGLKQQETEARGRSDLGKVVELRKQEEALVKSSAYSTKAQQTEAETHTLQAQIESRKQGVQLTEEAATAQSRANADILKGFEAQMQSRVKGGSGAGGKISEQQAYTADIKEAKDLAAEDKGRLDSLIEQENKINGIAEATKGSVQQAKLYWQEWQLGVSTQTKVLELTEKIDAANKKATDESQKAWSSFFSSVDSGVNKFLEAGILRTQTFSKAIQELEKSLLGDVFKLGSDIIGKTITQSITGEVGTSMATFLAGKVSSFLGNTASSVAGNATGGGITAIASAIFTPIVTAVTGLGATLGGLLTTLVVTTSATATKPEFLGTSYSLGGIVPSAAGGMVLGGGGSLAILHPREMVLPAHLSTGLQSMINGGGGSSASNTANLNYSPQIHGYHPYRSSSDFQTMLRQHGDTLMSHLTNAARNAFAA